MFVAETDFALAEPITAALQQAVALGDTGYTPPDPGIRAAFAAFARRRFDWEIDPARVRTTGDVMMGVVELLRATIEPGDRVVIAPPVYPPFSMRARDGSSTSTGSLRRWPQAPARCCCATRTTRRGRCTPGRRCRRSRRSPRRTAPS
jgi:bifunctional pyridoxal-dependent enzyme with beta-cystathionase and maltose regulon repressor activities